MDCFHKFGMRFGSKSWHVAILYFMFICRLHVITSKTQYGWLRTENHEALELSKEPELGSELEAVVS